VKSANRTALAVLRLLAWDLRVATEVRIAEHIGSEYAVEPDAIRSVIRRLRRRQLLGSAVTPAPLPQLDEPIISWSYGRPAPDFEAVAWAAGERVRKTPSSRVRVLWSTAGALRIVGGVETRLRKPLQLEHDLGVASMYFACCRKTGDGVWCGEDAYRLSRRPTRGQKSPDAVLLDSEGGVTLVLDYLTAYSAPRLRKFHHYWAARRKPYQWW